MCIASCFAKYTSSELFSEAKDIVSIFPILSLAAIAKADESIPPDNKNAFAPLIFVADVTTSLNVAENASYASSKE